MRTALAIAAALLALESFAGFQSAYCDTGDFPISNWTTSSVLQPKMQDKNAVVALAAGLGELHNGMQMRFGGDPTRETALAPYSNLVAQCKNGTMTRETLPHGIFPAMIDGFAAIKAEDYYQPYTNGVTNITILGVSPFMNDFGVNTAYARDLVNDVRYEYYSNLRTHNNVDYALFREVGARTPYPASRYGRAPTMYDAIHDEYVRVLGSGAATNVTASGFCCEDFVTSYNCPTESWIEPSYSARQCAWWRNGILDSGWVSRPAFAWRQLYYSPMTAWNMLGPQNFGMVYRWDGDMVGVVTTTRVWKAYCDIGVISTPRYDANGYILGSRFDYESHNTSNTVQYTVTTNWHSGSAHLENTSELAYSYPKLIYKWSSMSVKTNSQGIARYTPAFDGPQYKLVTNGVEYTVADPVLVPVFTNAQATLTFNFTEEITYTTVKSSIIHAPYDSDFPSVDATWNSPRVSSIVKVDVSGENWDGEDVSSSRRLAYNPPLARPGGTLAYIAGDTIAPLRIDCADEFAALAENCDASPVWEELSGYEDFDVIRPGYLPERFWWVIDDGDDDYDRIKYTYDFKTFNSPYVKAPGMISIITMYIGPSSYPNDHECEMDMKMAVFGFWRFTRWAHK